MAKGYWVSAYHTISDPENLAAYNKLPAVQAGCGRPLARGGRVVAHDAGIAERTVLIEFDSFEPAHHGRVMGVCHVDTGSTLDRPRQEAPLKAPSSGCPQPAARRWRAMRASPPSARVPVT